MEAELSMSNQFSLLKKRRFGPFFLTQFLGAFNDNVFKNALIILLTFHTAAYSTFSVNTLINLAGAIFILPFFIFSATFGQLADKYEKSKLIRITKLLEIVITIFATIGFAMHSLFLLLLALFLLGTQSTLFGPVKYSIIPQHLKSWELVGGNGLVESSTFVAILLGTVFGGVLISVPHAGIPLIAIAIIGFAVLGWWFSREIPIAKSTDPDLKINWNVFQQTFINLKHAQENRTVFLSVLGISWFWFYGAFMFYQVPNYAKTILGGNAHIATLLIFTFAVGIGLGSLLTERLSRRTIEIGLVPIGSVGLSVFTADLFFLKMAPATVHNMGLSYFFSIHAHYWILFNLVMIGVFGGLFTVPLYALIQDRSKPSHRSRIFAANNILNALLMVLAAVFAITLLKAGLTIPELFLLIAMINACVSIYIFFVVPEFILKMFMWLMATIMYRLTVEGIENLPSKGAAIYICNHISFVDVVILTAVSKRPIRFIMDHRLSKAPVLNLISRMAKVIPIASAKDNPELKEEAFQEAVRTLEDGGLVGVFPEGVITRDGEIAPFKRGLDELMKRYPVQIVPMALRGMWGSFFSRKYKGRAMSTTPKRFWSKISLHIGKPIKAEDYSLDKVEKAVRELFDEQR
jgi:1-acyl-sn-glycerol-3-phosphate acyltransferase